MVATAADALQGAEERSGTTSPAELNDEIVALSQGVGCLRRAYDEIPRVASAKMLPNGLVASGEMLPAIVPATMQPPLLRRGHGHQDDAHGAG